MPTDQYYEVGDPYEALDTRKKQLERRRVERKRLAAPSCRTEPKLIS